jgi:hypothetical protein
MTFQLPDYLAAMAERVRAGNATKEEQEAVAEALRQKVAESNLAYIRSLNMERRDAADREG